MERLQKLEGGDRQSYESLSSGFDMSDVFTNTQQFKLPEEGVHTQNLTWR